MNSIWWRDHNKSPANNVYHTPKSEGCYRRLWAKVPDSINLIAVGGNDYYVHQAVSHRFNFSPPLFHEVPSGNFATDMIPCTVVNWVKDQFIEDNLSAITANLQVAMMSEIQLSLLVR